MTGSSEKKGRFNGLDVRFLAIVHPGFEQTALEELRALDIPRETGVIEGGVEFKGDLSLCLRINRWSRCTTRVVMRIRKFNAHRFDMLQNKVAALPWEIFLTDTVPVTFQITSRKSKLYHTGRIGEELAAGIARRCGKHGFQPLFGDTGGKKLEQKIYLRIERNRCQVSIDSTGEALYKRGEKVHVTDASMRETLAASILREARAWKYRNIFDPMCGSGTFILEAAGLFGQKPPGKNLDFVMESWPLCREISDGREITHGSIPPVSPAPQYVRLFASDIDKRAVEAAVHNFGKAGIVHGVNSRVNDFFSAGAPGLDSGETLLVMNPPYGKRISGMNTEAVYRKIGRSIREHYSECGYAIIVPGLEMEKVLSLSYNRKILFMNGGIKVAALFKDRD